MFHRATLATAVFCFFSGNLCATEFDSDESALAAIFGDQEPHHLIRLYRQIADGSAEQCYDQLFNSVFPPGRRVIRIQFDFLPTQLVSGKDSIPFLIDDQADDDLPTCLAQGQLLAPAIDLIRMAALLNKTDRIEQAVRRARMSTKRDTKSVLAMRMLLAMEHGDLDLVDQLLSEFAPLVAGGAANESELGPETIVIWSAARRPKTREYAIDLIFQFYELARNGTPVGSERWRRHIYALHYLLQTATAEPETDWRRSLKRSASEDATSLTRWLPVSRLTAQSDGEGFPIAQWLAEPGKVSNVTGHDRDYLVYAIPLAGDFTIAAEVSPFSYRDTRLGFGGTWAGPGYDHQSLLVGHFGRDAPVQVIAPRLDEIDHSIRVKIVVENGVRSTQINGREVFQAPASESDPWLEIFSYWYTYGWVSNLRVTGEPTVPDSIDLLAGGELHGWNSFFGSSIGEPFCLWDQLRLSQSDQDLSAPVTLRGRRHSEYHNGFDESLIQYHRPIVEDARFTYEYFYQPGHFDAHPAIGLTAFLLHPSGVVTHEITNGIYDRTARRPYPSRPFDDQTAIDSRLPLNPNAWNQVEVSIREGHVTILLNDQIVFDHDVPTLRHSSFRQPLFGFFHYADRSESRVRKVNWHGSWPKHVPPELEQQLSDDAVERLLAGPELPATFHHDFATGIPRNRFLIAGSGWQDSLRKRSDGLGFSLTGRNAFVSYNIRPQLQIEGDFDVIAEFAEFAGTIAEGGDINIQLYVGFEEDAKDYRLYRKFSRFAKKNSATRWSRPVTFILEKAIATTNFLISPATQQAAVNCVCLDAVLKFITCLPQTIQIRIACSTVRRFRRVKPKRMALNWCLNRPSRGRLPSFGRHWMFAPKS